jgi:integrase
MPQKMLSDAFVKTVKPPTTGQVDYFDMRVPSFALRVTHRGVKSWVALYRIDGKLRRDTFARYPGLLLSDARKRAGDIFELARAGKDPRTVAERERAAEVRQRADTVKSIGEQFLDKYCADLRTHDERKRALGKYVYPTLGSTPIKEVTRRDVIELVDKIAKDHGEIMARRTYSIVRKMFKWSVQRDIIDANPCSDIALPGKERKRSRFLNDDEIRLVWRAAGKLDPVFRDYVRMLLVTAQRRAEVAGMQRAEINEAERLWAVPAERMKGKLDHAVPLTPMALELLAGSTTKGQKSVFTTRQDKPIRCYDDVKKLLDAAVADIQREDAAESGIDPDKVKPLPHWTLHDLRRTARTNMSRLGVDPEIAERVIAHLPVGVRMNYDLYQFLSEKRAALERWDQHLAGVIDPAPTAKVVSIWAAAGANG